MVNNYGCLGVSPDATPGEIRTAFRRLVREAHPDRFSPGTPEHTAAEDRLKTLNAAYSALSRPAERADYDRQLRRNGQVPRVPQQRTHSGLSAQSAPRIAPAPTGRESTTGPGPGEARQAREQAAQHLAARRAHDRAQADRALRRRSLLEPQDQMRLVLKWGAVNVAARRRRDEQALATAAEALSTWARHFFDSSAGSPSQGETRLAVCLVAAYRELFARGGHEPTDLRDVIIEATRLLGVVVDLEPRSRPVSVPVHAARRRTLTSWLFLGLSWAVLLLGMCVTAVVMFTRSLPADADPTTDLLHVALTVAAGAAVFGLPAWALHGLSRSGEPRDPEHKITQELDEVDQLRLGSAMARYDRARP